MKPDLNGSNQWFSRDENSLDNWATPDWLFFYLNNRFGPYTLDPCADENNHKVKKYFTIEQNGLLQSWENENVFMNPPFGDQVGKWLQKAYTESENNNALVTALVPARTCTKYFHEFVFGVSEITFIKGRIPFVHPEDGVERREAPMSMIIARYDKRVSKQDKLTLETITIRDLRGIEKQNLLNMGLSK